MKRHLKYLHSKHVIAAIYSVTCSVGFICQQFYALVLVKGLGLFIINKNTNQICKQVSSSKISIINNYANWR